jgi:hypothetical protein
MKAFVKLFVDDEILDTEIFGQVRVSNHAPNRDRQKRIDTFMDGKHYSV